MICNGLEQLTCDQAHAATCVDGKITECTPGYFFVDSTNCSICEKIDANQKGCEAYPTCKQGQRREGFLCIDCGYGFYCDGLVAHNC